MGSRGFYYHMMHELHNLSDIPTAWPLFWMATLAPSLGLTEKIFQTQDFWITFLRKKFTFSCPKFLMTFF